MENYICNGVTYVANDFEEAWLKALNEQGLKAMENANIKCENGDFCCHVCLGAYRMAFPQFSDEDFLNYEKCFTEAALKFPKIEHHPVHGDIVDGFTREGYQWLLDNSNVARYMEDTDFEW